jgi:hypothetical protein
VIVKDIVSADDIFDVGELVKLTLDPENGALAGNSESRHSHANNSPDVRIEVWNQTVRSLVSFSFLRRIIEHSGDDFLYLSDLFLTFSIVDV